VQGKELGYNNIADTDAAYELVAEFEASPACVIVKHANPCGVAVGKDLSTPIAGAGMRPGLGLRRHRRGQPPLTGRRCAKPSPRSSPRS
jgi:hypothetical protein